MLKDRRWIATLRCAKHVWPDAPDFKNETLRYRLGIDLPRDRMHRALEDATVTAHILARLLAERTVDELLALSTTPVPKDNVGVPNGRAHASRPAYRRPRAQSQIVTSPVGSRWNPMKPRGSVAESVLKAAEKMLMLMGPWRVGHRIRPAFGGDFGIVSLAEERTGGKSSVAHEHDASSHRRHREDLPNHVYIPFEVQGKMLPCNEAKCVFSFI